MPGGLHYTESKVDGIKELSVDPGWLYNVWVKMGLHKNSKMQKDEAILSVCIYSDTIGLNESLTISIDKENTSFKSIDTTSLIETDSNHRSCFKKRYYVKLSYIQKMVSGKNVWVKVTTNNGTYVEGEFTDGMTTAKRGFTKFLSQVDLSTGEIFAKPRKQP